jgi:hypothetical protein
MTALAFIGTFFRRRLGIEELKAATPLAPAFRPALPDEILVGNELRLIGRGHRVTIRADSAFVRADSGCPWW